MTEANESLEEILFELAVQKPTSTERAAFLNQACRDSPALRAALEALLEAHFGAAGFLPQPTGPGPSLVSAAASDPPAGPAQMIGRYKLLEKIGEGGFGEVWMAQQSEPVKRRVAFKIIKLGMDTRQVVARFEAERQALALMDHPNIARILDAGSTDEERAEDLKQRGLAGTEPSHAVAGGRPYFVMELVRGTRITDFCDQNQLSTHERLKLFIQVCQAIQHAHQKGIIHRDIKPSNILVTVHDGLPVPKVIDFGIAKATQQELTDKTLFTQFQQFIGTPAYISPEQAGTGGLDVDTRSDIYSLGVLLYELLVGRTPFDPKEMTKGGLEALRQIIREKEPVKPSTKLRSLQAAELTTTAERRRTDGPKLTHQLRGDLDWVVMKCLEKDRSRRYETANGLAMDVQRYLGNELVLARPPSMVYRVQKLVRRNRLALAAAALVLSALAFGAGAVIFMQYRANQVYRQRLYVSEVNHAGLAWQAGQTEELRALLDRCPVELRNWEWKFLHQQLDRRKPQVLLTDLNVDPLVPRSVTLSADGQLLVVAAGGRVRVHDHPTGQWLRDIPFASAYDSPFVLSSSGDWMATMTAETGTLTVWNLRTGERKLEIKHGSSARAVAWFNSGKLLATGGTDGMVRVWDAETGHQEREFPIGTPVRGLAVAPDDGTLAVGTAGTDIQLLNAASGVVNGKFRSQGTFNDVLIFSPNGQRLVVANATAGGFQTDKRVWSLDGGGSLDLHSDAEPVAYAFSGDSRWLAVADEAGMIQIWDLDRRVEVERFLAHVGVALSVQFLPDGQLLSAGADGLVKIWRPGEPSLTRLEHYPRGLRSLAFSPDQRWLAAAGLDSSVSLWDLKSTSPKPAARAYTNHHQAATTVAFAPDSTLASTGVDRWVRRWNPASLETLWASPLEPAQQAYGLVFSPDGRRIYAASLRETLTVLDAATGRKLSSIDGLEKIVDGLAIAPDGGLIAVCQKTLLSVRSAGDLHELWRAPAIPDRSAAFSPDGKWIATGDVDGAVTLWEVASAGGVRRQLRGHAGSVKGVSFHPDGSRLVSCGVDGRVKVWDWRAGVEVLTMPVPGGGILWQTAFSPDGRTIAAAGGDGVVTLWKIE